METGAIKSDFSDFFTLNVCVGQGACVGVDVGLWVHVCTYFQCSRGITEIS